MWIGDRLSASAVPLRALKWVLQLCAFAGCGVLAFLLRFEFRIPPEYRPLLGVIVPVWIAAKSLVFRLMRLDCGWWAFASLPDVLRLGYANVAGAALAALVFRMAPLAVPRSVLALDLLLCFHATAMLRLGARLLRERPAHSGERRQRIRAVIYGAGAAGVALLRELRTNPHLPYEVRGFIDDNPRMRGMRVQTVPVLGDGAALGAAAAAHHISEVLVAIPSARGPDMVRILENCHRAGLRCKTVPGLGEIVEGRTLAPQIREVVVEDLLGRQPVRLQEDAIAAKLEGRTVLVTGAAGSIGSEICRQAARFRPAAIVALDIAETPLFYLEQEMHTSRPDLPFRAEIGNIQSRPALAEVFRRHLPQVVFHAAAYKHVPVMERHIFEAVENNILGTWNVARAAAEHGAGDFVMISSDKAVRPASIMGVTKRVAELTVCSFANGGTKFVAVRFGNVLGSNGSVVPIFKRQIACGGPLTVTHPQMRRYFMIVQEAVQLVLQASTMGRGGEIFVLDMGEPARVLDLARNLILLSGLRPDVDIRIEFIGSRPGEKLLEELSTYNEGTVPTDHEKIRIFAGNGVPAEGISAHLERLQECCRVRDSRRVVLAFKELVPEYSPSAEVLRALLERPQVRTAAAGSPV